MKGGKSTARKKLEAVDRLKSWVEEKLSAGTLYQYIRNGMLNRSEIAVECCFARSTFTSNDLLKAELVRFENEFIRTGIIEKRSESVERKGDLSQLESKLARKEREVNSLRERLANKTAENEELRRKLEFSRTILDDIIPTGRRVHL